MRNGGGERGENVRCSQKEQSCEREGGRHVTRMDITQCKTGPPRQFLALIFDLKKTLAVREAVRAKGLQ